MPHRPSMHAFARCASVVPLFLVACGLRTPRGGDTEVAVPSNISDAHGDCSSGSGSDARDGGGSGAGGPPSPPPPAEAPDFGPNVLVFDPSTPMEVIQERLDAIAFAQESDELGSRRYAYLFRPGRYRLDVKIGFYTEARGLGASPDDVVIDGAVRARADWWNERNRDGENGTHNFWRGVENLSIIPRPEIDDGKNRWHVSQATHLRRVHVRGDVILSHGFNGWSSGGFIADSMIDGQVVSGTQQQFFTRNSDLRWTGSDYNMVFVGVKNAPASSWPSGHVGDNPGNVGRPRPYTVVPTTPRLREKPFLHLDATGRYTVQRPALMQESEGPSWVSSPTSGTEIPISAFHIAKPDVDTAETLNAALRLGKHILFTPGTYHLTRAIQISRPETILMGLGFATLVAEEPTAGIEIADVDGVTISGLMLDAGNKGAPTLLEVGPSGSTGPHDANPTSLFDVHCRVGGPSGREGARTDRCVTINSHHVIIDHMWLWRADHDESHGLGFHASWESYPAKNGIVVNGDDVTAYGLFVEHFQEHQTIWNGERGAVYFYQSELPYEARAQDQWRASPEHDGYASYKVADTVKSHFARGLGVYSFFQYDGVVASTGIEHPESPGISMHNMVTVKLGERGGIAHIVNQSGGSPPSWGRAYSSE